MLPPSASLPFLFAWKHPHSGPALYLNHPAVVCCAQGTELGVGEQTGWMTGSPRDHEAEDWS